MACAGTSPAILVIPPLAAACLGVVLASFVCRTCNGSATKLYTTNEINDSSYVNSCISQWPFPA